MTVLGLPISFMVAASENDVIGREGRVPWRQEADLDFMRKTIAGCPLIMGRKTHEAIGHALPDCRNIVVTRSGKTFPGCDTVSAVEQAIALAALDKPREIIIFGGGEIFATALPYADRMYLTRIHATIQGDAFFPSVNWSGWKEVRHEQHPADDKNKYPYTFLTYERKTPASSIKL